MKIFGSHLRLWVQLASAALSNGYVNGFLQGKIFKGESKRLCVPGLNCYSCPGALGSCPIGAFQAVISSRDYRFSFYVIGFLMCFGAFFGRFVCGWLCPFGLIQDVLHKIPFPVKIRKVPGDPFLKLGKYFIFGIFVVLLPMLVVNVIGQGDPWFCKWICPSGTLFGGIPLLGVNRILRESAGFLFAFKLILLLLILFLSVIIYRPFCRYLCPLGAVYSVFNPFSVYRYKVNPDCCTKCGVCQKKCELDIPVFEKPNSPDCIRCGKCVKCCPHSAISTTFSGKENGKKTERKKQINSLQIK